MRLAVECLKMHAIGRPLARNRLLAGHPNGFCVLVFWIGIFRLTFSTHGTDWMRYFNGGDVIIRWRLRPSGAFASSKEQFCLWNLLVQRC